MSLLAASPLLSSLFLTYANRAAALDCPPTPTPIDTEWIEMKTQNNRLQEEVALLRAQLEKETDRAKMAEDCVEALRAQLSSVKCANSDLETAVSDERAKLRAISSEYAKHKKETEDTISELRTTVDREAVSRSNPSIRDHTLTTRKTARVALSQVIADQQTTLAQLKEQNGSPHPFPTAIKDSSARTSRKLATPEPQKPDDRKKQDKQPENVFGQYNPKENLKEEPKEEPKYDPPKKMKSKGGNWTDGLVAAAKPATPSSPF